MTALIDVVRDTVERFPQRPALWVEGRTCSYQDLWNEAGRIARTIDTLLPSGSDLCGVFGGGSREAFSGILGVLRSGRGYVPLNPSFPAARTAFMTTEAGLEALVIDRNGRARLEELVAHLTHPLLLLMPDAASDEVREWRARCPAHRILGASDLALEAPAGSRQPSHTAYLMFTSGSTGKPKGVVVSNPNICHFVRTMLEVYGFTPEDRFSQMFELTFDLSLFDMFVCWAAGACLHVVPAVDRVAPVRFIRDHELSLWFSVPAVVGLMSQLRVLKPGVFPTLRWSLFCGEALPDRAAAAWQEAAPASTLENLYGPTEATVACTRYRWDRGRSPERCENGIVPIGSPYPGTRVAVVDEALRETSPGAPGELCLSGPQVVPGYWRNPDLTAARFVSLPDHAGEGNRWYRTGDLAKRDADGELVFLGRVDHQVKILGHRVELGEIEACLREAARTEFAVALPWPPEGAPSGVVACLVGSSVSDAEVTQACELALPAYMVPKRIVRLSRLPLNSNGKTDRNRILELVRSGSDE